MIPLLQASLLWSHEPDCRDLFPFSCKSISEVQHWCLVIMDDKALFSSSSLQECWTVLKYGSVHTSKNPDSRMEPLSCWNRTRPFPDVVLYNPAYYFTECLWINGKSTNANKSNVSSCLYDRNLPHALISSLSYVSMNIKCLCVPSLSLPLTAWLQLCSAIYALPQSAQPPRVIVIMKWIRNTSMKYKLVHYRCVGHRRLRQVMIRSIFLQKALKNSCMIQFYIKPIHLLALLHARKNKNILKFKLKVEIWYPNVALILLKNSKNQF